MEVDQPHAEHDPAAEYWRVPGGTLICRHGETATLLSTRAWRYFGLNASATRMWTALASGAGIDATAEEVAKAYGRPPAALRGDVEQLVATLTRLGFLASPRTAANRVDAARLWTCPPLARVGAASPPSLLASARALVWAGRRMRRATLDPASWLSAPHGPGASMLSDEWRQRCTRQVRRAAAWLPTRTYCLQESLALVVLLRHHGVAACLCLGARPYPFVAHAWVEVGGVAVNESSEHLAMYARFQRLSGAS